MLLLILRVLSLRSISSRLIARANYKQRVAKVVEPETLAFRFVLGKKGKRIFTSSLRKDREQSSTVPEGRVAAGNPAKNDPLCPNASNFKGAQFRIPLA